MSRYVTTCFCWSVGGEAVATTAEPPPPLRVGALSLSGVLSSDALGCDGSLRTRPRSTFSNRLLSTISKQFSFLPHTLFCLFSLLCQFLSIKVDAVSETYGLLNLVFLKLKARDSFNALLELSGYVRVRIQVLINNYSPIHTNCLNIISPGDQYIEPSDRRRKGKKWKKTGSNFTNNISRGSWRGEQE